MARELEYVLVLSAEDPVANAVGAGWGGPGEVLQRVEEGILRELSPGVGMLRRPGLHIADDGLSIPALRPGDPLPTLVFPSVHRSAGNRETLTVHPLGNPGAMAEVGGRPRFLTLTDPRRMADALRRVMALGQAIGWPASFEATHHGPALEQPAFFVEIGAAEPGRPPEAAVNGFHHLLRELTPDPTDRIAVGLGGGHYAPHFTDLVRDRRWAFGHLLPDHALADGGTPSVLKALEKTPGGEGAVYHRARDAESAPWADRIRRLRDGDAPRR